MRMIRLIAGVVLVAAGLVRLDAQSALTISVLSSRPDMVSGGDALIQIAPANGESVSVAINGQPAPVTLKTENGRLIGLVENLRIGRNTIEAKRGSRSARLEVTNYPITGPILSGEHLKPFVCNTQQSGLGEPLDENCSAPTKVEYFYRTNTSPGVFKPMANASERPADLGQTTTNQGQTVPYIVRVESGTINRAIYRIAILENGWNRRVMFSFGVPTTTRARTRRRPR
jgi:Tannase-like family of unknown function (DUF6351)